MQGEMIHGTVLTERRKEPRKRPLSLVYVELSTANGGMLRDLSEFGFAMRAMMPLRVGEITPFSFSLDVTTRLEGRCKVLWVEEDGRVAGLQFTEISENLRDRVRDWLGEKQVHPPPPPLPAETTMPQTSTMQELREEIRKVGPRPNAPDEPERGLPGLHVRKLMEEAEIHPSPIEETLPQQAEVRETEYSDPPAPREQETLPVLESLPSLNPLPQLEEVEFSQGAVKSTRSRSSAAISFAVRILMILALIGVGVVYHRPVGNAIVWLGMKIAGREAPEEGSPPKSENASPAQGLTPTTATSAPEVMVGPASVKPSSDTGTAAEDKTTEVPAVMETPSPSASKNPVPTSPTPLPATNKITTFVPPVATTADAGQQEYVAALDILKSKNDEAGLADGVRLLWVAVEKGNSNAEVTLAELYRQGRGVAKNCDQTKILLTAAARKGNTEAQKHLAQFLAEGCE